MIINSFGIEPVPIPSFFNPFGHHFSGFFACLSRPSRVICFRYDSEAVMNLLVLLPKQFCRHFHFIFFVHHLRITEAIS
jgi:hypothetical protein